MRSTDANSHGIWTAGSEVIGRCVQLEIRIAACILTRMVGVAVAYRGCGCIGSTEESTGVWACSYSAKLVSNAIARRDGTSVDRNRTVLCLCRWVSEVGCVHH